MKRIYRHIAVLLLLPLFSVAQKITYSDLIKQNSPDITVDILGKVNGHLLIFEDRGTKYSISIYRDDMVLQEKVALDFIASSKAYNINFIVYPDFFYIIYQYQKSGTVYCMAAKMDGNVQKINAPITLDTTHANSWQGNVVHNVIASENKQRIMIYKFQGEENWINFITRLYNDKMQLIHATNYPIEYDEKNNSYSDFQLDNDGDLIFTRSIKLKGKDDLAWVDLIIKNSLEDTFSIKNIPLNSWYIDDMKINVDNANKRYLLNSFYYVQPQGDIEGIYSTIWDVKGDSSYASTFSPFADSIRKIARESGQINKAFNEYFINKVILKKDGGYILVAEDHATHVSGNNARNHNNYNNYYSYYNKNYNRFYSYYYNILVCSISNIGIIEWNNIIPKNQSTDIPPNFLSFSTFTSSDGIHFLYNSSNKRNPLVLNNTLSEDGKLTRNRPLKNEENGCDFMIRYAKKTGARELIIPCLHRGKICFAKVDF